MVGWREYARRESEATIPTDEIQRRGRKIETTIAALKAGFPNWRELPKTHPFWRELQDQERRCAELIVILAGRGVEPSFGCGELANNTNSVPRAQREASTNTVSQFTHSEDYRSVSIRGKTHSLTSQQAHMIQILHEAHESGNSEVSIAHILEKFEKPSSRWEDTFKSNPEARQALIRPGRRKGILRLNL